MLSPEVFNFDAPDFHVNVKNISKNSIQDTLRKFHFQHLVSVILPDTLTLPKRITDKLSADCDYYKISKFNAKDLVRKDFITCFVRNGNISILSINARIDCDDCIALTPQGRLVLNINKDTYQTLGLEGKVSHFTSRIQSKFVVSINLTEVREKSNWRKIQLALTKLNCLDVIVSWVPPAESICPSSIAKYFFDLNYEVAVCKPTFSSHTVYSANVPEMNFEKVDVADISDLIEWVGMATLNGDLQTQGTPDNYINTYATPEPNLEIGQTRFLQWRGFFSVDKILGLVNELISYNAVAMKPWMSVSVQGFSDCAIAWANDEHHFYTNGDNGYVLLFDEKQYIFCELRCSRKAYKAKEQ